MTDMTETTENSKSKRLDQYKRRVLLTNWVGGGYLGIIGIISANVLDESPFIFLCIVVTLVVLGGFATGQVRIKYEWAATLLRRHTPTGEEKPDEIPADQISMPPHAEKFWIAATLILFISGLVLLMGVWYRVIVDISCH